MSERDEAYRNALNVFSDPETKYQVKCLLELLKDRTKAKYVWLNGWSTEEQSVKVIMSYYQLPVSMILEQRHDISNIPIDYLERAVQVYERKHERKQD